MRRNNKGRNLAWLLAVSMLLALLVPAGAFAFETWAGQYSLTGTSSEISQDKQKLVTGKGSSAGRMEMYVLTNGPPTPNADGYYIRLIDTENGFVVGIKTLEMISTEVSVLGKPDPFLMVGTGEFLQGTPPAAVGPAYVTLKGKALKYPTGGMSVISITSMTVGGGGLSNDGHEIVFSVKDSGVQLTQQP
jgi:hypothetical protein